MNSNLLSLEASLEARELLELSDKYKIGHIASALSYSPVVDFVFDEVLEQNPDTKILLGKPHGALALYRNWLKNHWITQDDLIDLDSVYLQSDQDRLNIPGVVYVANTLGNALGVGIGMALGSPQTKYAVLISDSSFLMGTTLEAIMQLDRFKPKNLTVYVDWNGWTSKEKMPVNQQTILEMLRSVNADMYFKFFENPKGYGVPEIEKEPSKWHY